MKICLFLIKNHKKIQVIGSESVDRKAVEIFKPRIDDIWKVLLAHASCAEEGTRNVVAECIGKLCLMDATRLLPKLKVGYAHLDLVSSFFYQTDSPFP